MTDQPVVEHGQVQGGIDRAPTGKIGVPELPGWVLTRPRLAARLTSGTQGPLTVVTGAPGAGKTVAVASWAASRQGTEPGPVAWVTLDRGDEDLAVFWRYLLEAFRRAGVELPGDGPAPFRSSSRIDHAGVAELASALARQNVPVVLVLDDLRSGTGSVLVGSIAYLLALARPWLRLVITSRRDLPLPLHRYRLTGDLTEIRSDDLAFGEREIDQFMTRHAVALRRDTVRLLRERTEGWVAGIRLAAMSMARHPDPDAFVAQLTGGDDVIAGYLVAEVLDALRPPQQRLVLATGILERVNAELAAVLVPGTGGPGLADVVGQDAFIRPLGHGWYRYHRMFRDVLRLRLQHESPAWVAALHRRAAAWFGARGLLAEAVRHAAAASDWQAACTLIVDRLAIGELLGLRPAPLLADALDRMPPLGASPELEPALVAAGLALGRGDETGYRSALRHAEDVLADAPQDDVLTARVTAALLRLVNARVRDEADAGTAAADVEKLLDRLPSDLVDGRPEVRALALTGRAATETAAGQWVQAAESLDTAHAAALDADSAILRLDCLAHGALVEGFRGRWGRASELATRAAQLTPVHPMPLPTAAAVLAVIRAWVALERYHLADARRIVEQAGPALRELSHPIMTVTRELVVARLDNADGHALRALETLHRLGSAPIPSWLARRVTLAQAEVHATAGAPAAAVQAANRAGGGHTADGAVALGRAQLRAGHAEAVLDTVRPAVTATAAVRGEVRIEAWLLDALACYATGNHSRGRRSLDRALRLGDREQVRLPFAALSAWLRPVLRSEQELARQYARLLEPLGFAAEPCAARGSPTSQGPVLVRQLSLRELEVLRHLAEMCTSEEIAIKMYVSVNTVKTHLKSIYRKLGVARRSDAVRRAHQLDLLGRADTP